MSLYLFQADQNHACMHALQGCFYNNFEFTDYYYYYTLQLVKAI
jgi:hypothetical protein